MEAESPEPSRRFSNRQLARRGLFWLGDLIRTPSSAIYWNFRKWNFVRRGRRGQCPCHDPSDSGAAGRTQCVAVGSWNNPAHFRKVCPLLVQTDHGWCCSVDSSQVRPFWGRLFAGGAALSVGIYLLGTFVTLAVMHRVGYRQLHYADVFWPGNWNRFQAVQANYYRAEGKNALQSQDYRTAFMAFATVMEIDPDYDSGMTLAVLAAYSGSYGYSDNVFATLLRSYPAQADHTAIIYQDQLVSTLRLRRLADLCLERLATPDKNESVWIRLLLFAAEHGRFTAELKKNNAARFAKLPRGAQAILDIYALIDAKKTAQALAHLQSILPADGVFYYERAITAMVDLGAAPQAVQSLYSRARNVPTFERAYLQYLISARTSEGALRETDFLPLLRFVYNNANFDRICALLIRTRDTASLERLWKAISPAIRTRDGRAALTAIWATARVCHREDIATAASEQSLQLGLSRLGQTGKFDFLSNRADDPAGLRLVLATRELPRETILALVAESVTQRLAAAEKEAHRNR